MNERNLNKLRTAILNKLGCEKGEFFPSQNGIDVIDNFGIKHACLFDFRSSKRFDDIIFSFTDDFILDLKAVNHRKSDRGLIIIIDKKNFNRITIINPRETERCGFNHHESYDERGELIHHFIKIYGTY